MPVAVSQVDPAPVADTVTAVTTPVVDTVATVTAPVIDTVTTVTAPVIDTVTTIAAPVIDTVTTVAAPSLAYAQLLAVGDSGHIPAPLVSWGDANDRQLTVPAAR